MTRPEFDQGLDELAIIYDKRLKRELGDRIFERISGHRADDWERAVESLTEDPEQRTFPRLGQILKALYSAAEDRIEAEANEQKARERRQIDEIMKTPEGDKILTENKVKLRRLLESVGNPKKLAKLHKEFEDEAAKDMVNRSCLCEDGLVFYSKQSGMKDGKPLIYSFVAACSRCKDGRIQPKSYPRRDPVELQAV